MYLDIIRRHRHDEQAYPPATNEGPTESLRGTDAVNTLSPASGAYAKTARPSPLQVADVLEEIGRSGSGPAKSLATYLDKPNAERLSWLTKAILHARSMGTVGWERYVSVIEEAIKKINEEPSERGET